jgi:pyruvate/2-oxoglutarate dehydrogenase complex dihydrolipoamide dehydrogenase (E3) component
MYRRFGSEVTVVEMAPWLIARENEEVSLTVQAILEGEGVTVRLNATCLRAERRPQGIAVQ